MASSKPKPKRKVAETSRLARQPTKAKQAELAGKVAAFADYLSVQSRRFAGCANFISELDAGQHFFLLDVMQGVHDELDAVAWDVRPAQRAEKE